jgi:hypothetical protein
MFRPPEETVTTKYEEKRSEGGCKDRQRRDIQRGKQSQTI